MIYEEYDNHFEPYGSQPSAARCKGNVDVVIGTAIKGWCCMQDGNLANVHVWINGSEKVIYPGSERRPDLTSAKISDVGGFDFNIDALISRVGVSTVEIKDQAGYVLPNGSFTISGSDIYRGHLVQTLGHDYEKSIGVLGDPSYAAELSRGSVLSKILHVLVANIQLGSPGKDLSIWFTHPTSTKPENIDMVNGKFRDAAKSAIDVAHRKIFGRGVCVNPIEINADQKYVVKSEVQAAHDGQIKLGKEITPEDFKGKVVQILIDNRIDAETVQDIRVPYIGGEIPFAYLKTRPISDRFSNGNRTAYVTSATNVLSDVEIKQIKDYCVALNLDYGELDVLRDSSRKDIWIVDVNNTPSGPPNGLSKGEADFAVREMAISFHRRFLVRNAPSV